MVRPTQTTITVSAAAVVFDSAGRVLLLDHVLRPAGAGWDIIGGYLSAREQPADALRRETYEEAGITIKNWQPLHLYTSGHHINIIYHAEIDMGEAHVNTREIIEASWFAPEELSVEVGADQIRIINLAREA